MSVTYRVLLSLLFASAFGYLFFPKVIQALAMRAVRVVITSRDQSLITFVGSKQYLAVVRAVGFLALAAAVSLSIASFEGG
jgi:hypothetical protein